MSTFALSSPAFGQAAPATAAQSAAPIETVVVTGIRASLKTSQSIKKNADQIVDSVTAVDIGALPDRNVADALQRVPGVTLQRTDANRDPVRYGGTGSNIFIRGLPWVESQTNGRDTFSAINGRSLSWGDISASLLAGFDVFKNPDATMIEGGIGGVVNLKTRKPFDQDGRLMALNVDYTEGELIDKGTFSANGLFSDRWETPHMGEIGALISIDWQDQSNRTNGLSTSHYDCVDAVTGAGSGQNWLFGSANCNAINASDRRYVPNFIGWRQIDWVQKRLAIDGSLQWRPNQQWEFTTEYLYSKADPHDTEYALPYTIPEDVNNHPEYTYNGSGVWTGGVLPNRCCWYPQTGGIDTRVGNHEDWTSDFSLNAQFNPSERWTFSGDLQYVNSSATNYSMTAYTDFGSPFDPVTPNAPAEDLTMNLSGNSPRISVSDPAGMQDPHNYYYAAAMDHLEWDSANSWAYRGDATYHFDDNAWLKTVDFGFRGEDKSSVARATGYNWNILSHENWQWGGNPVFLDQDVNNLGLPNKVHYVNYGSFLGNNIPGGWFIDPSLLNKSTTYAYSFLSATETGGWGWTPYTIQNGCAKAGQVLSQHDELHCLANYASGYARQDGIGGINPQTEDTYAGYAQIDYEHENLFGTGIPVDGNLGLRFVHTDDALAAGKRFLTPLTSGCPAGAVDCTDYNNAIAFLTGGQFDQLPGVSSSYNDWLPSFNARFHLSDEWQSRFSFSQSMVRPDFADMINQETLSFNFCNQTPACAGQFQAPPDGLTGTAGNPHLKPMHSNNFDWTAEWYFAPTGSLTLDVFHKDITDYFFTGTFPETITRNGLTYTFNVKSFQNGGSGQVDGFELAYQQFYDMLPGPLAGIGVQANYTYIADSGGGNIAQNPFDSSQLNNSTVGTLPLEGMSNNSYNVALLYAKYGVDARLAYNWRSHYLLTSSAANINQPMWAEDYGQLDASILYTILDHYKVGIQATNILNARTYLDVGYTNFHPRYDWIETDQKISFIIRATW